MSMHLKASSATVTFSSNNRQHDLSLSIYAFAVMTMVPEHYSLKCWSNCFSCTSVEFWQLHGTSLLCRQTILNMWPAPAKADFWEKISFADFSLELINNNFWLKCWKNYYSIFFGSRDMDFLMLSYSKLQFREKHMQSLLIQIEILSSACVVYLEFVGTTKAAKRPNEVIF